MVARCSDEPPTGSLKFPNDLANLERQLFSLTEAALEMLWQKGGKRLTLGVNRVYHAEGSAFQQPARA